MWVLITLLAADPVVVPVDVRPSPAVQDLLTAHPDPTEAPDSTLSIADARLHDQLDETIQRHRATAPGPPLHKAQDRWPPATTWHTDPTEPMAVPLPGRSWPDQSLSDQLDRLRRTHHQASSERSGSSGAGATSVGPESS